jgi:hypothetical protein
MCYCKTWRLSLYFLSQAFTATWAFYFIAFHVAFYVATVRSVITKITGRTVFCVQAPLHLIQAIGMLLTKDIASHPIAHDWLTSFVFKTDTTDLAHIFSFLTVNLNITAKVMRRSPTAAVLGSLP